MNNWPVDERKQVPSSGEKTWTNSRSFQSAVENNAWAPPDGWDDTPAGDVDQIQILNHGAANMEFDPATLAAHELFTEKTGIEIDVLEVPAEQATTRQQQFLSSNQGKPHAFNVNGPLLPVFIQEGWLQTTDALYPEGSAEPYIPALSSLMQSDIGPEEGTHWYGYPNITEGSLGHLRVDIIEEQGLDPATFQGEWTWDDLENLMQAFEGTDVFGFGYYAGDAIYLSYSYRELLYQQGARMVQDDGTVKVDSDASVRVIQKMAEWREKGWVPGDVVTYGEGDLVDTFLSGQIAMATGFSDFVPQAVNKFGTDGSQYLAILPPAANAGPSPTQASLVDPNATSVNPNASIGEQLAAMVYGDLKLSYAAQWWEFTFEGNMSYLSPVYDDAAEAGAVAYADILGNSIDNGVVEVFPQMQSVFTRMLTPAQRAIQGEISAADAMGQVQTWVDDNINSN